MHGVVHYVFQLCRDNPSLLIFGALAAGYAPLTSWPLPMPAGIDASYGLCETKGYGYADRNGAVVLVRIGHDEVNEAVADFKLRISDLTAELVGAA